MCRAPSTWVLDSKDRHAITMGWTCCYHPSLLKHVQDENSQKLIGLKLKERKNSLQSLQFRRYPDKSDEILFVSLQLLDIATTNYAMRYDCVYEANPLLPKKPHLDRLILHKMVFLWPSYEIWRMDGWSKYESQWYNMIGAIVVANNLDIIDKAKKICP